MSSDQAETVGDGIHSDRTTSSWGKFRYEQLKASNKKLELNRSRPMEALVTIKVRVSN